MNIIYGYLIWVFINILYEYFYKYSRNPICYLPKIIQQWIRLHIFTGKSERYSAFSDVGGKVAGIGLHFAATFIFLKLCTRFRFQPGYKSRYSLGRMPISLWWLIQKRLLASQLVGLEDDIRSMTQLLLGTGSCHLSSKLQRQKENWLSWVKSWLMGGPKPSRASRNCPNGRGKGNPEGIPVVSEELGLQYFLNGEGARKMRTMIHS